MGLGLLTVPVNVSYDFDAGAKLLRDLPGELLPSELDELKDLLEHAYPQDRRAQGLVAPTAAPSVASVQATLYNELPNVIAIAWQPTAGHLQTESMIKDVVGRIARDRLQKKRMRMKQDEDFRQN